MPSTAAIEGHPFHAILVNFPVALLCMVLLLDVLYLYYKKDPIWARFAYVTQLLAVLGLIAAAIPGLIDYYTIPMAPVPSQRHLLMGIALLLFSILHLLLLRPPKEELPKVLPGMALFGAILVIVQGYLGGELVYRYHVGIIPTPESTAPSDISHPGSNGGATQSTTAGGANTTAKGAGAVKIPGMDAAMLTKVMADFKTQCLGCHKLAAITGGGDSGPDLSHEGKSHDKTWISQQILRPSAHKPNTEMPDFPETSLPKAEREAIAAYLGSLQ